MIKEDYAKVVGFSIKRSEDGFEPCLVFSDLGTAFLRGDSVPMSSADAIREGRSIARAHKMPFRSRISAFKSLIQEDSSDA